MSGIENLIKITEKLEREYSAVSSQVREKRASIAFKKKKIEELGVESSLINQQIKDLVPIISENRVKLSGLSDCPILLLFLIFLVHLADHQSLINEVEKNKLLMVSVYFRVIPLFVLDERGIGTTPI
jgi:hypothetical protein